MGNAKYGMPYQGSKTRIADELIAVLPPARHFYDCFGGGGAMTHAAALSGKYEHVHYNEFNPTVADAFRRALAGDTPDPTRWISRKEFDRLKESDFQTALMWSFGTKGDFYMYAPEREPWHEAVHYAFFCGDVSKFHRFGIYPPELPAAELSQWIKGNARELLKTYFEWYKRDVLHLKVCEYQELKRDVKEVAEECRKYLRCALDASGKTRADVDRYLGTNGMAGHYFGRSQWEFPTRETYERLRAFLPTLDKSFEDAGGLYFDRPSRLERLETFNKAENRLKSGSAFDWMKRLDYAQRCRRFANLTPAGMPPYAAPIDVICGSYADLKFEKDSVIYCDPPYEDTEGYLSGTFDTGAFLAWCERQRQPVWLSETKALTGTRWERKWSKKIAGISDSHRTELLYRIAPLSQQRKERRAECVTYDLFAEAV